MSLSNYDAWKLASPPEPDVAGKCEECTKLVEKNISVVKVRRL